MTCRLFVATPRPQGEGGKVSPRKGEALFGLNRNRFGFCGIEGLASNAIILFIIALNFRVCLVR